jgi:hypothetical protein
VIGLIGCLRGFLSNPLGHGIGVGGNLSMNMNSIDWSKSQHLGHTDVAVESSVGVLLYQMGVFAVVMFVGLAWIAVCLWKHYRLSGERLYATAAFSVLVVSANGVFHEEAMFSPLALGVVLAVAGLLLGRAARAALHHDYNPSFSTPGNCTESAGRRRNALAGSPRAASGKAPGRRSLVGSSVRNAG